MTVAPLPITLTVNGTAHEIQLDPRTTVLDALREHLHLTGAKKGCDRGQCGACTVLLDGRRVNSCLLLAASASGGEITTIEGFATEALHPMQQAFIDHDALQCGYCTPGQICSAIGMLTEVADGWPSAVNPDGASLDAQDVRERMSGNLCRCGAYANIVPAVLEAAQQ
jgi:xanthine dehydrogenase YagT iron-sulfur-binding subunit